MTPAAIAPTIARDSTDDQVLAAAPAAQPDLNVSADDHMVDLNGSKGIDVVTVAVAAERIVAGA